MKMNDNRDRYIERGRLVWQTVLAINKRVYPPTTCCLNSPFMSASPQIKVRNNAMEMKLKRNDFSHLMGELTTSRLRPQTNLSNLDRLRHLPLRIPSLPLLQSLFPHV